jgi:hypothetical protein
MAAMQANHSTVTEHGYSGVFEYSVLESLLHSSPAAATLLFSSGVDMTRLTFPPTTSIPGPLAEITLDFIFCGADVGENTEVPTATQVRKCGILNELDILIADLEAAQEGMEPNTFGYIILEGAGIEIPGYPRDYNPSVDSPWRKCDSYLNDLTKKVRELALVDPSHALLQFILFTDDRGEIRIRPFGTTGLSRMSIDIPIAKERGHVFRGNVIQPIVSVLPGVTSGVLEELEGLINSYTASESDFQRFFEDYPSLLAGLDFKAAHPQPILTKDDGKPLIPDFFLEAMTDGWDTILDLKRPYDDMVTRRKNRVYFKQHVHNAVAQLRFYREWFDSPTNREAFRQRYGFSTYKPRMVIVIGRHHHFLDDVERIRLIEGLPSHLEIWTYDKLLHRVQQYLSLFG